MKYYTKENEIGERSQEGEAAGLVSSLFLPLSCCITIKYCIISSSLIFWREPVIDGESQNGKPMDRSITHLIEQFRRLRASFRSAETLRSGTNETIIPFQGMSFKTKKTDEPSCSKSTVKALLSRVCLTRKSIFETVQPPPPPPLPRCR